MIKVRKGKDNKKTFLHIKESPRKIARGISNGLYDIGKENVRHLKTLIQQAPATGRYYRRRGVVHRASAKGEPPASDTGNLANTTDYKVRGVHQVEFGDTAEYGKYLEESRPHVERTAFDKARDNLNSLTHAVDRELKRR